MENQTMFKSGNGTIYHGDVTDFYQEWTPPPM